MIEYVEKLSTELDAESLRDSGNASVLEEREVEID
jgi:hypothetical protein